MGLCNYTLRDSALKFQISAENRATTHVLQCFFVEYIFNNLFYEQ